MGMHDWCDKSIWVFLSGGVSAVFPVHEPGGLQLCHWRQPHRWIHVLWGFSLTYYTDLLPSKNLAAFPPQGTACSSCPSSTSCVDSLCQAAWSSTSPLFSVEFLYVLNEKFCLLKFFSVCASWRLSFRQYFVSLFVDWLSLSNQKQIQITIWWWDAQACLVFCCW